MSEIQVGQINSTDGSTAITTGADGYVSFAKTQIGGRRNLIINGAMQVAQRGTSAITANGFPVDRFKVDNSSPLGQYAFSMQQDSSAPAGFHKSVKLTVTTAETSMDSTEQINFRTILEGQDIAQLNWGTSDAQDAVLSFWVRSSVTGNHGAAIFAGGLNQQYPFLYNISQADTWERKTITIPATTSGTWPTDNGAGMYINWSTGAGSSRLGTPNTWTSTYYSGATGQVQVAETLNATWYITGVQLEVGTVATPFEHRSYGEELALCQRYFQIGGYCSGRAYSNSNAEVYYSFPIEMRTTPSISMRGDGDEISMFSGRAHVSGVSNYNITAVSGNAVANGCSFNITTQDGLGGGSIVGVRGNFANIDAEL